MSVRLFSPVPITRAGVPVVGSPFQCRVYLAAFPGARHEVEPDVVKTQTAKILTFQNVAAPIAIGDMATLPDGTLSKLLNIRLYTRTLQVDMQTIPYQLITLWTPTAPAARVDALGAVKSAFYTASGTILAYVEPMADISMAAAAMMMDTRTARCFSLQAIPTRSVLKIDGDYWIAKTASEHWSVTNDYITMLTHLNEKPNGVA